MAAITANERQELVALYLTMFGTAPTVVSLAQMVVARESGSTLFEVAASLATNAAFAPVASRDANSFATWLADALLAGDVPAVARAWALNWVVTQLDTKTKAQIIAEAVQAIRATENPNYATSKVELSADVANALILLESPFPKDVTYTLTANATDIVKTSVSDDTIIGQLGPSITLQASDSIDGGAGNDTFRIITDSATAQAVSGFTVVNVETLEVQAQAAGGTTLGLENMSGLTTLRSKSSNAPLTLDNVKNFVNLEVAGGAITHTLRLNYQSAVVEGLADTQQVMLDGGTLGSLTINGIETLAFTTKTADSSVPAVAGSSLKNLTVAGDKMLTFTVALPTTITNIDASAQTAGGISLTAAAVDMTIKGGAGNDRVNFTGTLTTGDSFNGGAGRDTIVANVPEFIAASYAVAAKISNVEVIQFSSVMTVDFDAGMITGEDSYILDAGFLLPVTISKLSDGATIDIRNIGFDTLTLSIGSGTTLATVAGTNNTLHLAIGGANGLDAGIISAAGVETLTLASNGSATALGGNNLTLIAPAATKLTVTGAEDLTLVMTDTALTTLDASSSTGANDFSLVTFHSSAAATITGGAGADKIRGSAAGDTIKGGAGNDTIAGGGGADILTGGTGIDTFYLNAASDSSSAAQDTITDFVPGTDLVNLQDLATLTGRFNIVLRADAAADFAAAQSSIKANSGSTQVVFQADTNTLWVDVNDDGKLNTDDVSVKLTGVTKIAAGSIGGVARPDGFGNLVTIIANGALINATTASGATVNTTASDDAIWGTSALISGLTLLDGLAGSDTLRVTDAGNITVPSSVTNVEAVILATDGTTANTLVFNGGHFTSISGSANADTVTTANMVGSTSGVISLGAGNDTLTLSANLAGTSIDMGADNDTVNVSTGVAVTAALAGGGGNDILNVGSGASISGAAISGFETVNATAVSSDFTLPATLEATSVKLGSGNDTITTVTANASAAFLELGDGNDAITTLNVGAGNLSIDFGNGTGTITNLATRGGGLLTLKFGAMSGAININGTAANLVHGDVFDFAATASAVVVAAANGLSGSIGGVGQVFVDSVTNANNTIITFDADGSRTFTAGDVQITLVGNVVAGSIDGNGNFAVNASA